MNTPSPLRPISYVRDIRGSGDDDRPLRRAVRAGALVRIHRGAFMSMDDWMSLSRVEQHRHQAIAATLAGRSRPTLSHRSAAVVWGIPFIERLPSVVDVLSTPATGTRTEGGYRRHATRFPDLDIVSIHGARVTGLHRTVVEYVSQAPFPDGVAALDWVLSPPLPGASKPVADVDLILQVADSLELTRGRRKLQRAIEFADPRSGSPGESASRAGMHLAGVPAPELQVEFRDRLGLIGFVDFWWPEFGLVGEFDGLVKYTDQRYTRGAPIDEIVVAEKKREDRLRAVDSVRGVIRWLWPEAVTPAALAGTLHAAGLPVANRGYPGLLGLARMPR